jgi:hypothetical protein
MESIHFPAAKSSIHPTQHRISDLHDNSRGISENFASSSASPAAWLFKRKNFPGSNCGHTSDIQSTIYRHIPLAVNLCVAQRSNLALPTASVSIR